jgi:nitric oxide reductase activation protein
VFWTRYYYKEHKLKLRAPQLLAAFEKSRTFEEEASLDWGSDDDNDDAVASTTTATTDTTAATADTAQTAQVRKCCSLMSCMCDVYRVTAAVLA